MSMHFVVVSIEGDRLAQTAEVLAKCGYAVEGSKKVKTGTQASSEMVKAGGGNHTGKAVYVMNGWTFIVDPELVLMGNDAWLHYSKKWKARIVAWMCEGASGTYGLALYEGGKKRREVVCSDGNLVVDEGKPLAEESKFDWGAAGEETILKLAERLGAEYEFPDKGEFTVYKLASSDA